MKVFSDISLWWIIPILFFSIGISIFYYRNQKGTKDWSKFKLTALIALRSLGLIALFLLLLGILFESNEAKKGKPVVITLVDSSISMLGHQDSNSVAKNINSYLSSLKKKYGDRMDILTFSVGENEREFSGGFKDESTDLYAGFDFLFNQYYGRDQKVVCLISDGNFNKGVNPVYAAEKLSLTPIYTLAVGDTMIKKDHFIRNVSTNEVAFFKNQFPIKVDVEARKLSGNKVYLKLLKDGEEIDRSEITYSNESLQFMEHTFLVNADKLGFVAYQLQLEEVKGEVSYENNISTVYVEVLDSRSKILILADAPHPDVTAVKKSIEKNENLFVEAYLINDWNGELKEFEMAIVHLSKNSNHSDLINKLKSSGIGLFYMLSSSMNAAEVSKLGLSIQYPSGSNKDDARVHLNNSFQTFEVSEELKTELLKWPPLNVKFGSIKEGSGSNVLLKQRIGSVKKEDPVLIFKDDSQKIGVLLGDGIWRWKMMEYASNKSHRLFNELISKSVQFLTIKENKEPFRVTLPKRFRSSDEILINAEFYNQAMQPIVTPTVSFSLKGETVKESNYAFAKNQKSYTLNIGKLIPGKYEWEAFTEFEGKKYVKKGAFVVEHISLEMLESTANHAVLKTLSEQSGGTFFKLKEYEKMLDHLGARKDLVPKVYHERVFSDLIDKLWLFVLVIIIFSTEWFVRRYSGNY